MDKERYYSTPLDSHGNPLAPLSDEQRAEIFKILKQNGKAANAFVDCIESAASQYRFWAIGIERRAVRRPFYRRGHPPDRVRIKLSRHVAKEYQRLCGKAPSPWDNTRFNRIMAIVFEVAGCHVADKRRRQISKKALSDE